MSSESQASDVVIIEKGGMMSGQTVITVHGDNSGESRDEGRPAPIPPKKTPPGTLTSAERLRQLILQISRPEMFLGNCAVSDGESIEITCNGKTISLSGSECPDPKDDQYAELRTVVGNISTQLK